MINTLSYSGLSLISESFNLISVVSCCAFRLKEASSSTAATSPVLSNTKPSTFLTVADGYSLLNSISVKNEAQSGLAKPSEVLLLIPSFRTKLKTESCIIAF